MKTRSLLQTMAIAGLACVLAGCAGTRWGKPGEDPAALEADLRDCRLAGEQVSRLGWLYPPRLFPGRENRGNSGISPPFRDQADLFALEQNAVEACMRDRGYARAPVQPAAKENGSGRRAP